MRPDEHKKKHRAEYKKKHGIPSKKTTSKEKNETTKDASPTENREEEALADKDEVLNRFEKLTELVWSQMQILKLV